MMKVVWCYWEILWWMMMIYTLMIQILECLVFFPRATKSIVKSKTGTFAQSPCQYVAKAKVTPVPGATFRENGRARSSGGSMHKLTKRIQMGSSSFSPGPRIVSAIWNLPIPIWSEEATACLPRVFCSNCFSKKTFAVSCHWNPCSNKYSKDQPNVCFVNERNCALSSS